MTSYYEIKKAQRGLLRRLGVNGSVPLADACRNVGLQPAVPIPLQKTPPVRFGRAASVAAKLNAYPKRRRPRLRSTLGS